MIPGGHWHFVGNGSPTKHKKQSEGARTKENQSRALDQDVTTVTIELKEGQMPKTKSKKTPGQKLWLSLYRADLYDKEAEKINVPHGAPRLNPEGLTKRWLEGMSRQIKETFPAGFRKYREQLG